MSTDLAPVVAALRAEGARFAYLHGSRAEGTARVDSDTDVAAHYGGHPPTGWGSSVGGDVDLVVLDRAPLYLAGRIALHGKLLFDDDPPARVAWEADTRLRYLDEQPATDTRVLDHLRALAGRGRP